MPTTTPPAPTLVSPPLEQGDHLTREEFERRYDAMPGLKKAELIEGIVYMGSPVRFEHHATPHADCIAWLGYYRSQTPGVLVADNGTVSLEGDNMPQPDAAMLIEPGRGGRTTLSEDDYVEGGPELVVEIAASTASLDLNAKLRVYLANGVPEYLVWRVFDGAFDWFILRDGRYDRLEPAVDGTLRSEVFPGLWLDPAALIAGDLAKVLGTLRVGLATPGHAGFVARLAGTKK